MATSDPPQSAATDNFLIALNKCRADIHHLFSELNTKLVNRKNELLSELDLIEKRYDDSNRAKDNLKRLETLRNEQNTLLISMESMANLMKTEAKLALLQCIKETELDCNKWKAKIELFSNVSFSFDSAIISDCINKLGNIKITLTPNYTNAPLILYDAAGTGTGKLSDPHGIAVDANDNIYITDFTNSKILVFSITGEFSREFGQEYLKKPYYLCINDNTMYVNCFSDLFRNLFSNFIIKCNINGEFIAKTGSKGSDNTQFNHPCGLYCHHGLLYICDNSNHRIQVLSEEFTYQKSIKHDNIRHPRDIYIRDGNIVYVITNKALHILAITGDYIRTLPHTFTCAYYFTLDTYNNVLISDYGTDSIIVISLLDNTIIHTISNKETKGIAVTSSNAIVNVCRGANAKLQLFKF